MDKKIDKKRKPWLKIALWIGLASGLILLYTAAGSSKSKLDVDQSKIKIASISYGDFQERIPVNGTVEPMRTVFLDAIEGGTVEEIFVEDGTYVKKGTPLIKLSNTSMVLDYMNRETQIVEQINNLRSTRIQMELNEQNIKQQVLEIEYQLADMQQQFEIDTVLYEQDVIARKSYNESKNKYAFLKKKHRLLSDNYKKDAAYRVQQIKQIDRSINMMERNLEAIRKNLENLTIKAPVSGVLTSFDHEIGENKVRGENLGRIDLSGDFRVSVLIDEHFLPRIKTNQNGSFLLDNQTYHLKTSKILPQVENRQFEVKMNFKDSLPEAIRRGQNLIINLELSQRQKAILLPRGSFYNQTGGKWLFVLDNNGQAHRREIKIGRQNPDYYEVLEGLKPDERVITSSYQNYIDKDIINIK